MILSDNYTAATSTLGYSTCGSSSLQSSTSKFIQTKVGNSYSWSLRVTDDRKTPEGTDYTKLWSEMREKISLVKSGEPLPGQGTFGHIVGGYDAGYYG